MNIKNYVIIMSILLIAATVITVVLLPSFFIAQMPAVEQAASKANKNNIVVIDMTTQQWKFLPIGANPSRDDQGQGGAILLSVPNGDAFADTTISVEKGAALTLRIKNLDVTHGFGLDEFGINKVTPAGEVTEIKFVADKQGIFSFYCTVFCGTGHPNHKGTLIVEA